MSHPVFRHPRDHARTLASLAATTLDATPPGMSDGSTRERVHGQIVSAAFFDVFRIRRALGRLFRDVEDHVPHASPVRAARAPRARLSACHRPARSR